MELGASQPRWVINTMLYTVRKLTIYNHFVSHKTGFQNKSLHLRFNEDIYRALGSGKIFAIHQLQWRCASVLLS